MMRRFFPLVAMTVLAGTSFAGPALAQNASQNPGQNPSGMQANPTVPVAPPGSSTTTPPEKIAPRGGSGGPGMSGSGMGGSGMSGPNSGQRDGTMSNTLSRQHGTIAPPNVDPGIAVQPPRNGISRTPVIPPPGSSGGGQTVIPK
jgi:hypothetical protein